MPNRHIALTSVMHSGRADLSRRNECVSRERPNRNLDRTISSLLDGLEADPHSSTLALTCFRFVFGWSTHIILKNACMCPFTSGIYSEWSVETFLDTYKFITSLALLSAQSLPGIPIWLGIHRKLIANPEFIRSWKISCIFLAIWDDGQYADTARRAEVESMHVTNLCTYIPGLNKL